MPRNSIITDREFEILYLRMVRGLSLKEIAAGYGASIAYVSRALGNAAKKAALIYQDAKRLRALGLWTLPQAMLKNPPSLPHLLGGESESGALLRIRGREVREWRSANLLEAGADDRGFYLKVEGWLGWDVKDVLLLRLNAADACHLTLTWLKILEGGGRLEVKQPRV